MGGVSAVSSNDCYLAAINFRTDKQSWTNTGINKRLGTISDILKQINEKLKSNSIDNILILLPAGWIDAGDKPADNFYECVRENITTILKPLSNNIAICIGIDGDSNKDQTAIAIDKNGIIGLGRKFFPTSEEGHINISKDYCEQEIGMPRLFPFNGVKFYLAVCYDSYGIRKKTTMNPGAQVILNLVHNFNPRGEPNSGDVYFAKNGFAGSSKQWNCITYGSAIFFNKNPGNWPNGVYWDIDEEVSTKEWKYKYNPIKPIDIFETDVNGSKIIVKLFNISKDLKSITKSRVLNNNYN